MYVPRHFAATGRQEMIAFMQKYSFATIVSLTDGLPVATHLPFVVTVEHDKVWLSAHFARANRQWEQLSGGKCLVIFQEPHAYISPVHYEKEQSVPTWNYIAVHAYGNPQIVEAQTEKLDLLGKMILQYEPAYNVQWQRLPDDYKMRMLNGIVVFRMHITDIQASYKLSQNKTFRERQDIIDTLSQSEATPGRDIADYMARRQTASPPK